MTGQAGPGGFQSSPARGRTLTRLYHLSSRRLNPAPARGATGVRSRSPPPHDVSPAPRGGGHLASCPCIASMLFPSTPRAGGRRPTWIDLALRRVFQSSPPAGGDAQATRPPEHVWFQSSPRAGGDLGCSTLLAKPGSFNPRPRRGGATTTEAPDQSGSSFNHARAAGDLICPSRSASVDVSSTPPRGATVGLNIEPIDRCGAIHAPRGGRLRPLAFINWTGSSISPRAGGDNYLQKVIWRRRSFNPHPARGGGTEQEPTGGPR